MNIMGVFIRPVTYMILFQCDPGSNCGLLYTAVYIFVQLLLLPSAHATGNLDPPRPNTVYIDPLVDMCSLATVVCYHQLFNLV